MPRAVTSSHAGERDTLITIERLNQAIPDRADSGFPVEKFRTPIQVWAKREFVSMDEDTKLDQLSAHSVQRWQIPYRLDMDPDRVDVPKTRRLIYQNRTYDIQTAEMLTRPEGKEIVLTTLSKVG